MLLQHLRSLQSMYQQCLMCQLACACAYDYSPTMRHRHFSQMSIFEVWMRNCWDYCLSLLDLLVFSTLNLILGQHAQIRLYSKTSFYSKKELKISSLSAKG